MAAAAAAAAYITQTLMLIIYDDAKKMVIIIIFFLVRIFCLVCRSEILSKMKCLMAYHFGGMCMYIMLISREISHEQYIQKQDNFNLNHQSC